MRELASFPSGQRDQIAAFVRGAEAVLTETQTGLVQGMKNISTTRNLTNEEYTRMNTYLQLVANSITEIVSVMNNTVNVVVNHHDYINTLASVCESQSYQIKDLRLRLQELERKHKLTNLTASDN